MLMFHNLRREELPRLQTYYGSGALRWEPRHAEVLQSASPAPAWAEAAGCLLVCRTVGGERRFDYPAPGPEGDAEAALTAVETYCTVRELRLVISAVPEERVPELMRRYPRAQVTERGTPGCTIRVGYALESVAEIPALPTARLTLDALTDADRDAYSALCLDEDRNRWWGYDYRQDLRGPLTEDYFLSVAREDFACRRAVNFAVRLAGRCIGEAVLYHDDWRGGMELGCRIAREHAGCGYGTEAFASAADWALRCVGLAKVTAKCYHENAASLRMLSSCMYAVGGDATFDYFERRV